MRRSIVVALGTSAVALTAAAIWLAAQFSATKVGERISGLVLRNAKLLTERSHWPAPGNTGYSLIIFQLSASSVTDFRALCERRGFRETFRSLAWNPPGFAGELGMQPESCVKRDDANGAGAAITPDLRLVISVAR